MQLLFDHFDRLADAPNGVAKLRELVLQLAVRGKLVPQDPDDEPALELLKRIESEKGRAQEGRKETPLSTITEDEIGHPLPRSWAWCRLGEVISFEYGKGLSKSDRTLGGEYPVFGANGVTGFHDKYLVTAPCIVIGRKGSAGALNISRNNCWPTDVTYFAKPPKCLDFEFSFKLLQSLKLETLGKGIKPGLNRNEAYNLVIALPPKAEQKRIVAKVDQLMQLCDELEQQQEERRQTRISLNNAALNKLTTSIEPTEFNGHWRFVSENFNLLYRDPENVSKLKQAILQLAVHGKLVPQDPNDEPASELLQRIKAEKERLIAEGRIKKQKPLPQIVQEEILYELPTGWVWCRLGELCYSVTDGPHFSPRYVSKSEGVPFLSTRNVTRTGLVLEGAKYVSREDHLEFCKRTKPELDDVIYTKGGTTGIAVVNDLDVDFSIWVHLAVLKIEKTSLVPRYVADALNSPHIATSNLKNILTGREIEI